MKVSFMNINSLVFRHKMLNAIVSWGVVFLTIKMMNTSSEGVRNNSCSRYPFTASQWQELEHQALVYKYIISGMPIPSDLLITIKTSLHSSTNLFLHHQPPHPSIGWKCLEMGFGRKIDPEPGRCRRTDGKKWRCSKEAYPDSKYCERHMHRGRNRSRKPVEISPQTTIQSSSNSHSSYYNTTTTPSSINLFSSQHHFFNPTPYRKSYGMKEEMDKHSFFTETSGTINTSMGDSKQSIFHQTGNSYQQDEGFYYDQIQLALKTDRKDEPQKVMHHFFDEWPPNDNNNNNNDSATQLSISMPSTAPARDFFLCIKVGSIKTLKILQQIFY
ncbi:hypothetical protein QVD17_26553 [Tagetes erecta]|uniref:Growth-regulating factor n=1 Tax=Tagetes erecta TaxID=13708 RepID=A0AAD8K9M5_TARER|nr:hypothetical protein QVD17_26553 [Tagetes erecta]